MSQTLIPVGVRLSREQIDGLTAGGERIGPAVRTAVDKALANGGLVELMGATQAAAELGVASGNLGKVAGLSECVLYAPELGGPSGGRLYSADAIRALAARRAAARA